MRSNLSLVVMFVAGCSSTSFPAMPDDASFTPGEIAVNNLNSQIEGYERAVVQRPSDTTLRAALVGLLLTRTQFLGTYDDFARAQQLADEVVGIAPQQAESYVLRSSVHSALHEFDDALDDLVQARTLDASVDIETARDTIRLARGENLFLVLEHRRSTATAAPSYATLSGLAAAEAAVGDFDSADQHYYEALELYRDVSPFAAAWIAFQRGVMWGGAGGKS